MRFIDMKGIRYNRLVAIRMVEHTTPGSPVFWTFKCDCGAVVDRNAANVRYGRTKSCGCLNVESARKTRHGLTRTKTHNIWCGMRQRCGNPNSPAWKYYGGRGITVCGRWESFDLFLEDMGEAPDGMTIERIDNNKGYSPDNCRWATTVEQVRNRRTTMRYAFEGKELTFMEWSEETGIPYKVLWHRHKVGKRGHSLFAPVRRIIRKPKAD